MAKMKKKIAGHRMCNDQRCGGTGKERDPTYIIVLNGE